MWLLRELITAGIAARTRSLDRSLEHVRFAPFLASTWLKEHAAFGCYRLQSFIVSSDPSCHSNLAPECCTAFGGAPCKSRLAPRRRGGTSRKSLDTENSSAMHLTKGPAGAPTSLTQPTPHACACSCRFRMLT